MMNLLARWIAIAKGRPIQQWEAVPAEQGRALERWEEEAQLRRTLEEIADEAVPRDFTWTCWYCKQEFDDMAAMNLHYYGYKGQGCNGDVVIEVPDFDEDWAQYAQTVEYLTFEHDAEQERLA